MIFKNREEAGLELAQKLIAKRIENPFVLALPRGGLPIGLIISQKLNCPLGVIVARKLTSPHNPEFGIGAIAEKGTLILDENTINYLNISPKELAVIIAAEKKELKRRLQQYRQNKPLPSLKGKTLILVDDGLATGVTAQAAINSAQKLHPQKIMIAIPVGSRETIQELKKAVDQLICLQTPRNFNAVGQWYQDFHQVSDSEVATILNQAPRFTSPIS